MNLYNKYVLPSVINCVCGLKPSRMQRAKIVPHAIGNVLEIGIGSGLNLPFYDKDLVRHLTAIDPSLETWQKNKIDTQKLPFDFEFIQAFAEDIPVDNNSIDTVVMTYALCTIPDTQKALEEIRRVLKSNGKLLFCEHGKAPDAAVQKWQNSINPIWKRVGGGCHLNKDIPKLIKENGFNISELKTMYIPGWKPASFNFWGSAEIK